MGKLEGKVAIVTGYSPGLVASDSMIFAPRVRRLWFLMYLMKKVLLLRHGLVARFGSEI
jgi:hypothetical protein